MSDPAWELNCEEREELARSNARLAERERDEALSKVDRQRERLARLEHKYAAVKGDLDKVVHQRNAERAERHEAEAQRDALHLALLEAINVHPIIEEYPATKEALAGLEEGSDDATPPTT